MARQLGRSGRKPTYTAIVGSLALILTAGLAGAQDQPSASQIIKSLTPPPRSVTRGLSAGPADTAAKAKEKAFIDSIRARKTRSLSSVELDRLATITEEKPNIDLEIRFEFNSDRISQSALPTVEALGKALTDPSLNGNTFILAGHADATGATDYNQDLSERRAEAVKQYLVENYRIPETNLVAVGYGETHLKNPNDPVAAENRRVAVVNMDDSQTSGN